MESRGESHAGVFLHGDKQNNSKQEQDMHIREKRVWQKCERERKTERERELSVMMSQDPSGVLLGSQKRRENCKRLMSHTIVFEETPESADGVRMINTKIVISD